MLPGHGMHETALHPTDSRSHLESILTAPRGKLRLGEGNLSSSKGMITPFGPWSSHLTPGPFPNPNQQVGTPKLFLSVLLWFPL